MSTFDKLNNISEKFQSFCAMLSSASMVILILLTVFETGARYLFRAPLEWAIEFPSYLLTFSTAIVLSYTQMKKGHISVTFLEEKLSKRGQDILNIVTLPIYFFTVSFISIAAFRLMLKSILEWRLSAIMQVPLFIPQAMIFLGFLFLCIQLIFEFVASIRRLILARTNQFMVSDK